MKNIVIATANIDKFNLVKNLLFDLGLKDWDFKNLSDYTISNQTEEVGSSKERAAQKARFFLNNCTAINSIDLVVGIDDGIILNGSDGVITDSKTVTQQILSGKKIKIGEEVVNHRAFCFIFPKSNKEMFAVTELKFSYLGNSSVVKLEEGKYPLSHVLGYSGHDNTVAEMSSEEVRKLNVEYSQEDLRPIIEQVLKI